MKNTFAVTMTLLLALVLGGSVIGYNIATRPHEAAGPAASTEGATGEAPAETAATGATAAGATATGATAAGTTANAGTPGVDNTNAAGATGNAPHDTAAAAHAQEPAGDAAVGQAKFAANCAACHGANAEGGMGGMAPKLDKVKGWTLDQFKTALRDLKAPEKTLAPPMMKFTADQVTDAEVAGIYAWLKTVN